MKFVSELSCSPVGSFCTNEGKPQNFTVRLDLPSLFHLPILDMKTAPIGTITIALLLPLLALAALTTVAFAAPVAVNNRSFENRALGAGGWTNDLNDPTLNDFDDPDWIGQAGPNSGNAFVEFIGGFKSEGNQHVGMAGGYYAFQNTGIPYEANTLYTLTVGVGYRNAGQSGTDSLSVIGLTVLDEAPRANAFLEGFDTNGQLALDSLLESNAVTVDSVALNNAVGLTFTDVTVEFATDDAPPAGNIVIFIGDDIGGVRSHFDNVRLDATSNLNPDGDNIPSEWETGTDRGVARGLDPNVNDGGEDPDGDTLTNFEEFEMGTHPQLADTDGDGLKDNEETVTDPLDPDSDGDTLSDGAEVLTHTTDPNKADSDGDQFEDQAEVAAGSDPKQSGSIPANDGDILLGVNFVGGNAGSAGASVAGIAGVVGQGNWNNAPGGAGDPLSLVDNANNASILRVKWATNGPGVIGVAPGADDADAILMHGILLPRGSGAGGDDVITRIELRNIAYPTYDLYLYVVSDGASEATFTANVESIEATVEIFDGEFGQIVENFDSGNYIVFKGLTGPTLTITGNVVSGTPGIAGFQIVRSTTDTDGDGMPNIWEEANGLAPTVDDASLDPDNDGSNNLAEFKANTNPQDNDTDDDGLLDGVETNTGTFVSASDTGTNPRLRDTDRDGLSDKVETNTGVVASATDSGSDPNNADSDGDGVNDGTEIAASTNPSDKNSFPPFPVPIAYWSFDDGAQETDDLIGSAPGTVNGGAVFVEGHTGNAGDQAIQFDGIDSSVTTDAPLLDGLTEFTVAGWVKFDVIQPGRTGLFGQNDLAEMGPNPTIAWWMADGGIIDTGVDTAAEWTHLAMVGSKNGRVLYIDGEIAGENDSAPSGGTSAFNFNIGGDGIWDGSGNFFEGLIDDVAVWDLALSKDQVKQLADGTFNPLGGAPGPAGLAITEISVVANGDVLLTWNSRSSPGTSYAVFSTNDLSLPLEDWSEIDDIVNTEGESTTYLIPSVLLGDEDQLFFFVRKN